LDETGAVNSFTQSRFYTIPYGSFVPISVDGLLLAGRNISGTHIAHSNYRVMPICAKKGESVGIAAAMCVKKNVEPRDLDVFFLQERLLQLGLGPEESQ
jgi:hypothetical protein